MLALAFVLLAASVRAWAGERWEPLADSVFQHYTQDQGLPQPIATSIAQDGDGFVWVGTQGGLARWDGYRFRVYQPDAKDPGALPDNFVSALHTDASGRLWVGTSAGGLAQYDREHDRFVVHAAGPHGLSDAYVRAIAADGATGLWIGTDGGLDHLDLRTNAIRSLRHDEHDAASLPDDHVMAVLQDRSGRLWIGTKSGLLRRDAGAKRFEAVPLEASAPAKVAIHALIEDDDGRVWIGTTQRGAYVVEPGQSAPRPVEESGAAGSPLRSDFVRALSVAGPHEVWVGTMGGIVAVDTTSFRTRRIRHEAMLPGSLMHDNIWSLLRDRAGSMWVGSTNGLDRLANGDRAVSTVLGAPGRSGGVSDGDVSAILPVGDGTVWLGLGSGAIDIVDPERGVIASLRPDPAQPEQALPKGFLHAMAAAHDAVFVGTDRGLYRVGLPSRSVQRVTVPHRETSDRVDTLLLDAGVLWIGGRESGLDALPLDGASAPVATHLDRRQISDQRVNAILRGRVDELWIGTDNGLNRLDLRTGAVERIAADAADPAALAVGNITSLRFDRAGRLWVGTLGGGIAIATGRDPAGRLRFRRIGIDEGLPNANVAMLLEDAQGKIWASTDDGLAAIDPGTLAVRALHRAEGVAIASYWAAAGAATGQGELLFGGLGGMTVVRPGQARPWTLPAPVVVTDISIGGKPVPAGRHEGAGAAEPLDVRPDANRFAVEFAALDFTAPERNRYAYRLEGYDPKWIATTSARRLAAYTNLPPGDYTLRLRGSNRDGVWNTHELAVPIRVAPAWYQTAWFRLLAALATAAAIAAFVRARTARLRRRHRELERLVEERDTQVRRLEQTERLQRALYAIADLSVSPLERPDMLREMHRIVAELMYAENFFIALHDPHRRTLRLVYFADVVDKDVYDPDAEIPESEMANSLTVAVIRRGKPLMGASAELCRQLGLPPDESAGPDCEAWLGVPMLAGDEVRGAIVVQSYDPSVRYTASDQALLAYVAGHILTALTRRQAQEELEQRVESRTRELARANRDLVAEIDERKAGERLQAALFRIAELTSSSASMSGFYASVHAEIGKLLYARNFFVALLIDGGTALDFPYADDEVDGATMFKPRVLRRGLSDYVLRTGKPLLATPATVRSLIEAGEVEQIGTPSVCWLGVPLELNEGVAGVLVVQSYTAGIVYSARDRDLLTFVSLHIATALQRLQAQESLKLAYVELQNRLSELRRTQTELIENEKMASLGRLVAGVAHEINTPLGIGVTAASYLEGMFESIGRALGDGARPEVLEALEGGRRCAALVLSNLGKADQLVKSFKQVAVDQSSEVRRRIEVRAYLDEVLVSLGPRLKKTSHRVEVDCPADLAIDTYPGALYQIVANLVLNALLHAFDDKAAGCIRIVVRRIGDTLELTLTDDGKGMPEDVRVQVFEPFFTTRRGTGGTGLGLHMVYNLVTQLLRGTIACASTPGQGTRFTIRLPVVVGAQERAALPQGAG